MGLPKIKITFKKEEEHKTTPLIKKEEVKKKEPETTKILANKTLFKNLSFYKKYTIEQLIKHQVIQETDEKEQDDLAPAQTRKRVLYIITEEITDDQANELVVEIEEHLAPKKLIIQEIFPGE